MRSVTVVSAILFFGGAVLIAGACADKNKDEGPRGDYDAMGMLATDWLDSGDQMQPRVPRSDAGLFLDPGGRDGLLVTQAIVTMKPINGGRVEGTIRLMETNRGVRAGLDLAGLTYLSKYTLRVHMLGNCSADDGSTTGPGFSFDDSSLEPSDPNAAGLLGEIQGELSGVAKGEATIEGPAIVGPWSIVGRSIVLHESPSGVDTDPQGKRIGCGVVGIHADIAMPGGDF